MDYFISYVQRFVNSRSERYDVNVFFLCDFLMWENFRTYLKFGPEKFSDYLIFGHSFVLK